MLARLRSDINLGKKERHESVGGGMMNVNEEYFGALRTKSYADFFKRAQTLIVNHPSTLLNHGGAAAYENVSEILLEPQQETIKPLLESSASSLLSRKKSDLKTVLFDYFDMSAEASEICSGLLRCVNQLQSNHFTINRILDSIGHDHNLNSMVSEIHTIVNSHHEIKKPDFAKIHDKYTTFLKHLKSKKRMIAHKIKLIQCFNKAFGICVTAACGAVAIAAMVLAAHTLAALVLSPALFSLPIKPWKKKKKVLSIGFLKCGFLRKIGNQLDVAAKGTYILDREFDTMSRLVARLHDEIEHNKEMIHFCFTRKEDNFSLKFLKDLKRSDLGFGKQIEELEEHVYLCLVTINRARALVAEEITK